MNLQFIRTQMRQEGGQMAHSLSFRLTPPPLAVGGLRLRRRIAMAATQNSPVQTIGPAPPPRLIEWLSIHLPGRFLASGVEEPVDPAATGHVLSSFISWPRLVLSGQSQNGPSIIRAVFKQQAACWAICSHDMMIFMIFVRAVSMNGSIDAFHFFTSFHIELKKRVWRTSQTLFPFQIHLLGVVASLPPK